MLNVKVYTTIRRSAKLILVLLPLLFTSVASSSQIPTEKGWLVLFDGMDLSHWDSYLGPYFGPGVSWENIEEQPPIGLNNDTMKVFSIVELDGEKVLRISGEAWGGIFTKKEFENYHLQLQFKWGDKKWYPREKVTDKRDSGLLYHGIGSHGQDDLFWLKSQEFQIQEGDCGDFWGVAGTIIDVRAQLMQDGKTYQYNANAPLLTFTETGDYGRYCKKSPDAENPSGTWNTLDLYCFGGTSVHMVNGTVTMILENSRHRVNGAEVPLTKGKIEIQSESAEVYYRNIKLKSIDRIPQEILNAGSH